MTHPADTDASTKPPAFAFLKATWHADIVDQALLGFRTRLTERCGDCDVDSWSVPGAFELPLMAKRVARTGCYRAVVAAALIVDGGIYRHDFVAQAVVSGLMTVGLETGVPVLSVALTPHHFQPTDPHSRFFHEHFREKGREAADAALDIEKTHRAFGD